MTYNLSFTVNVELSCSSCQNPCPTSVNLYPHSAPPTSATAAFDGDTDGMSSGQAVSTEAPARGAPGPDLTSAVVRFHRKYGSTQSHQMP